MKQNKRRNCTVKFCPDHAFIKKAVEEYLKNGGKITKITPIFNIGSPVDNTRLNDFLFDLEGHIGVLAVYHLPLVCE